MSESQSSDVMSGVMSSQQSQSQVQAITERMVHVAANQEPLAQAIDTVVGFLEHFPLLYISSI